MFPTLVLTRPRLITRTDLGSLVCFLTVVGEEKAVSFGYGVTGYFFFSIDSLSVLEEEASAEMVVVTLDLDKPPMYAVESDSLALGVMLFTDAPNPNVPWLFLFS